MAIKVTSLAQHNHHDLSHKIVNSMDRHIRLLGLEHWSFEIRWESPLEGGRYGAETRASPEYYDATVTFDLDVIAVRSDQVDQYVRHELIHCIVWPLAEAGQLLAGDSEGARELIGRIEERVTSDLERLPLWDKLAGQ